MDVYLDTNTVSYSDEYPPHWTAPVLAIQKAHLVVDPWVQIRADGKRKEATADPARAVSPGGRKETE